MEPKEKGTLVSMVFWVLVVLVLAEASMIAGISLGRMNWLAHIGAFCSILGFMFGWYGHMHKIQAGDK